MTKIEQAINALRMLPTEEQEFLAEELLFTVSARDESILSPDQREEVEHRLDQPFTFATDHDVQQVLQRY